MGLLTFEFYDFGPFYDRILRLDPESVGNSPLNNRFNLMGYQYLYIVKNLGALCLTIFTGPLLFVACSVLAFMKHKIFQTAKIRMQKQMRLNYWITLVNETFLVFAVCCGLNIFNYFSWSTPGDGINSMLSLIISVLVIVLPFFVAIWYNLPKNYSLIKENNQEFF